MNQTQTINPEPVTPPLTDLPGAARAAAQVRRWRQLQAELAGLRRRGSENQRESLAVREELREFFSTERHAPDFQAWTSFQKMPPADLQRLLAPKPRNKTAAAPAAAKPPRPALPLTVAPADLAAPAVAPNRDPLPGFCACGLPLPAPTPEAEIPTLTMLENVLAENGKPLGAEPDFCHALYGDFLIAKFNHRQKFSYLRSEKILNRNGHNPLHIAELLAPAMIFVLPEHEKPFARAPLQHPIELFARNYKGPLPPDLAQGP